MYLGFPSRREYWIDHMPRPKQRKPFRVAINLPPEVERIAEAQVGVLGSNKSDVLRTLLLSVLIEKGLLKKK